MSISSQDLKGIINESYSKKMNNYKNYILDKSLSGQRVKVFVRNDDNFVFIVHRGTKGFQDVITDLKMGYNSYDNNRFKYAEKIQKLTEEKYGSNNVITIGHSLGSQIAQKIGQNSKQIITLNKPVLIQDLLKIKNKNQIDIRNSKDPISILAPFEKKNKKEIEIPANSLNPLQNHSVSTLDDIDDNLIGGRIKTNKAKRTTKWIDFVKSIQKEKNISYKEALKISSSLYKS